MITLRLMDEIGWPFNLEVTTLAEAELRRRAAVGDSAGDAAVKWSVPELRDRPDVAYCSEAEARVVVKAIDEKRAEEAKKLLEMTE